MKSQNYSNYVRMVPAYHYFLVPLSLISLAAAVIHLFFVELRGETLFIALMFLSLSLITVMTVFFARRFACKVQDRAIRAEENLRHYVLTGQLPDPRLTKEQIIALRFASDEELLSLSEKAVKQHTDPDSIKRAIQTWRADHDRV